MHVQILMKTVFIQGTYFLQVALYYTTTNSTSTYC
jgi:hypothetical protein